MANSKLCSIPDCGKARHGARWCDAHYKKYLRHGDPLWQRPPRGICSVPGCGNQHQSRGFCNSHYQRSLRHGGDPLSGGPPSPRNEARRFYRETVLTYEGDECLIWPFSKSDGGYGLLKTNGQHRRVSNLVCREFRGSPPTPKHEAAHSCGHGHLGCVTKRHMS